MATKEEPKIDDVKGIVALSVFIIYIILSVSGWLGFGFSISSAFALITFFIAFFGGIRTKKNKVSKEDEPDKAGIVVFGIWFLIFGVWILKLLPDYSSRLMFLMLTAAIATSMKPKDIILFLGLSALTAFFFESGVLATMVLIVTALFAYACRESAAFGAIMMVPLLMVGWFVGSGWGNMVEQQVSSISTKMGATTGISTEGVGSGINAALNNTWLMLTDPNAWYEKQFVIQGNRDTGATSSALEITKIEALPSSMNSKDTFDISFELENKGTKHAQNIFLGAKATTLANACGKINGKFCNLNCIMDENGNVDLNRIAEIKDGCPVDKTVKEIAPLEKRFDTFGFRAPECPGTYSVSAMMIYDYDVDATLNMQMISRKYYDELIRNNKMVWIDELSTTSAGPFKLSLRTDRKQPIPDMNEEGTPQKFRIYLGFVNEHEGRAVMNFVNIGLPKEFESIGWDSEANIFDDSCNIFYGVNDSSGKYFEDELKEKIDSNTGALTFAEYDALDKKYKQLAIDEEKKTNRGYLTYRIVDSDKRKMNQNEWRYYKCGFQLSPGTKIDQIQTLFARANMNYTFEYEKQTTVTVRSTAVAIPHCDKKLQPVSAISTAQTIPQTEDAIKKELANEMFNCYNTNDKSIYHTSSECGKFKIDIQGCGDTITAGEVSSILSSGEPYVRIMKNDRSNVWVLEKTYDKADSPLKYIDIKNPQDPAKDIFKSDTIYQISMKYVSNDFLLPYLMTNPFGVALSVIDPSLIRNSLLINIDSNTTDPLCIPVAP